MDCIEIKSADNGFVLRYKDPEIAKRNSTSSGWQDPYRDRVYNSAEDLVKDLTTLLPIMAEYSAEKDESQEFSAALSEAFGESD